MADDSIISKLYAEPIKRAEQYALLRKRTLLDRLGYGADGIVFSTSLPSVVKALKHQELYERELRVYQHLKRHGTTIVGGFNVPVLMGHHPQLWIIEMTAVSRPFVLDFVSAGIGRPLIDWPRQVLRRQEAKTRADFGADWPRVRQVIVEFRRLGIYLSDIKRGNIEF